MLDTLTSDPCKALFNLSSDFNSDNAEWSPSIDCPDKNVAKIPFAFKAKNFEDMHSCNIQF